MNISTEHIDELNAILCLKIVKSDYEDLVSDAITKIKKTANVKGFRPGYVPFGLLKKKYGTDIKLKEINSLVSESIKNYIKEENLKIIGEPVPKRENDENLEFVLQEDYIFNFEIGLLPDFDISLSTKNKLLRYEISPSEKQRIDMIESYRKRFGTHSLGNTVEVNDLIKVNITQLDENGKILENGIFAEHSTLLVDIIKDDKIKESFIGKQIGDILDIDLYKAFPNDIELSGLLQKNKEELGEISGLYRITILEINKITPAEVNQELFDLLYGKGVVNSEKEFIENIDADIAKTLKKISSNKFKIDTKQLAIDNTHFDLPEDFLKRWLFYIAEESSIEDIEKDFENYISELRWRLIQHRVFEKNELNINFDEVKDEAYKFAIIQSAKYGNVNPSDEIIKKMVMETLDDDETSRHLTNIVTENMVLAEIEKLVKIESKPISLEAFNSLKK